MEDNLKRKLCNELIRQGKVKEGDIIRHSYTNSRFDSFHIENKDNPDCCFTIATRADCIGVVVKDMIEIEDKNGNKFLINNTKQLRETIERNKLEHGTTLDLYNRTSHNEGIMQTIDTGYHNSQRVCVEDKEEEMNNYRIRKLTARECFRLQGVKNKDFDNIAENQSNASLYHLAGDSITTSVLMAIFGELFGVEYKSKIRELEEDIAPDFDWSTVEEEKEKPKETIYEQVNLLDLL